MPRILRVTVARLAAWLGAMLAPATLLHGACPDTYAIGEPWRAGADVIVVGELHGTNEFPALFSELVCRAAASGRPVLAGLELGDEDIAPAVAAARVPGKRRRAILRAAPFWTQDRDGKSSAAYFALIERIERLARTQPVALVGFDTRTPQQLALAPGAVDLLARRRDALASNGARPLVLLLTGNGHSGAVVGGDDLAQALRDHGERVLALNPAHGGGTAWTCVDGACGTHAVPADPRCARTVPTRRDANGPPPCIGRITASPPMVDAPVAAR